LGFRVWGLGFGDEGLSFRVLGLGFKILGFGFRVSAYFALIFDVAYAIASEQFESSFPKLKV